METKLPKESDDLKQVLKYHPLISSSYFIEYDWKGAGGIPDSKYNI